MVRDRLARWFLALCVIAASLAGGLAPQWVSHAADAIPLVVSLPALWKDLVTPEMLTPFEAQYGVDVIPTFTQSSFGFFLGAESVGEEHLDATEALVTSADVLYVDPATLTPQDTLAGYFLDLMPLAQSDPSLDSADIIPAVWQSYQWDGRLWALPLSTDVILVTYDPSAFDAAGLAYPSARWTMDDFANAARVLTVYDADGSVLTPGFSVSSGGSNQEMFLRALLGAPLYDAATLPAQPHFADPTLEALLSTWHELLAEGVAVAAGGAMGEQDVPLRVEGILGYGMRLTPGQRDTAADRYASLLPGGVAGLNVQGFAVSAGTQHAQLAYELAKFLSLRPELASNPFSVATAHYSLSGGQPSGLSGGGGRRFGLSVPPNIQPTVDQALNVGLPVAELRYAAYLDVALAEMNTGADARSALQNAEAQAVEDVRAAEARYGAVELFVTPPLSGAPSLQSGEIVLKCAVNSGFGARVGGGGQLAHQAEWDQLVAEFAASDPEVGAVLIESTTSTDLAALAADYDCFILPTNAVPGSDLSPILNLDPLIDNDPSFDRNDTLGNTLAQLQQDNKTWALPLAIQPQMLQYDPLRFEQAGVPEPLDGWTVDAFADALRRLKPYDTDPPPFVPNDPSGAYMLMLIGAYGGLPLDFRTDPPTVNFTDPTTVEAIRQVLDLVKDGYIAYKPLTNVIGGVADVLESSETGAITTNTLTQYNLRGPAAEAIAGNSEGMRLTTYPQGRTFGVIAYEITTGYISASAQNPQAAYRFLSAVARSPQLFSGMPARGSLVNDPLVAAAQGPEVAAVYRQLDTLLRDPNTLVFPTFSAGRGVSAISFVEMYWLNRAMDRYVLQNADLEAELAEAELLTRAYQDCAARIVVDESGLNPQEARRELFQQIQQCAVSVDPTFSLGG